MDDSGWENTLLHNPTPLVKGRSIYTAEKFGNTNRDVELLLTPVLAPLDRYSFCTLSRLVEKSPIFMKSGGSCYGTDGVLINNTHTGPLINPSSDVPWTWLQYTETIYPNILDTGCRATWTASWNVFGTEARGRWRKTSKISARIHECGVSPQQ